MPFDNAGAFRSLSYVWGPEKLSHKKRMLVTPQGILEIKASLGAALQRLRQQTKELVLWVDAICINQEDEDEKVKRISLLPQMFQRAICTLAVVATDDKSEQTVRTLLQIAAVQAYGSDVSKWPEELGLLRTRVPWMRAGLPAHDSTFWEDVTELFQRPWFRRAWIVQEAIAARTVTLICGRWTFDWNVLHSAMEVVDHNLGMTTLGEAWRPFMILTEHREWEARSHRWPLLSLLETFRYAKAGFQRDRFFSLLGLAMDADNPLFEPDYKSPFEQIVRRFAQAFIGKEGGMRLLCLAGLGHVAQGTELRASSFPSWVPDWTRETTNRWSLSSAAGRGVKFSASGKLKPWIRYNQEADELDVAGFICDCEDIMLVSRFCNEPSQRSRYFQELDSMIDACELIHPDRRQELKETVPVAGALYPDTGVSSPVSITGSYAAFRKALRKDDLRAKSMRGSKRTKRERRSELSGPSLDKEPVAAGFREKSMMYEALLDSYILGWRFVITKSGRCGIAPNGVLPGDNVAILSGGKVPFILREGLKPGLGIFLVGECYIDGMMFGEEVEEYATESAPPFTLSLS